MSKLFHFGLLISLTATASAQTTYFWHAWEGDDLPEYVLPAEDWTHMHGTRAGAGAGQADAAANDGVLYLDSRHDRDVYDIMALHLPVTSLGSDGVFVAAWGCLVEATDPGTDQVVGVAGLHLQIAEDHVAISGEDVTIPIEPGVFHDYTIFTSDLHNYSLYIDGRLARSGTMAASHQDSYVLWGDGVVGHAARAQWDYFRCGWIGITVPFDHGQNAPVFEDRTGEGEAPSCNAPRRPVAGDAVAMPTGACDAPRRPVAGGPGEADVEIVGDGDRPPCYEPDTPVPGNGIPGPETTVGGRFTPTCDAPRRPVAGDALSGPEDAFPNSNDPLCDAPRRPVSTGPEQPPTVVTDGDDSDSCYAPVIPRPAAIPAGVIVLTASGDRG